MCAIEETGNGGLSAVAESGALVTRLRDETARSIAQARLLLGDDLFRAWFVGVNLENAVFMRAYYRGLASEVKFSQHEGELKRGARTSPRCVHLMQEFERRIARHLSVKGRIRSAGRRLLHHLQPCRVLFVLGSRIEVPAAMAVHGNRMDSTSRTGVVPAWRRRLCGGDVHFVMKKWNPALSEAIKHATGVRGEDLFTLAAGTAKPWQVARHRRRWESLLDRLSHVAPAEHAPVEEVLDDLLAVLSLAYAVDGLLKTFRPACVIGALEKSAFGALFGAFSHVAGGIERRCRVATLQHGLVTRTTLLDRLEVDRFFVWDEATLNVLLSRGELAPETLRVVGRPGGDESTETACPVLTNWKGGDRLILVCAQPISLSRQKLLAEVLLAYLAEDPGVRLVVRMHPAQDEGDEACWRGFVPAELSQRVRIERADRFSLGESLAAADLVCADYSAALVDARHAGRNALSLMTEELTDPDLRTYFEHLGIPVAAVGPGLDERVRGALRDGIAGKHQGARPALPKNGLRRALAELLR